MRFINIFTCLAYCDALLMQLVAQLSCAHERMFQVQSVQSFPGIQIVHRYRLWQVVHAASTDALQVRLLANRQQGFTVYHRFALCALCPLGISNPALLSAPLPTGHK